MSDKPRIRVLPPLTEPSFSGLIADLEQLQTLSNVVAWGGQQQPPVVTSNVVTQDEFTHDVIAKYQDEIHLVFDTT